MRRTRLTSTKSFKFVLLCRCCYVVYVREMMKEKERVDYKITTQTFYSLFSCLCVNHSGFSNILYSFLFFPIACV